MGGNTGQDTIVEEAIVMTVLARLFCAAWLACATGPAVSAGIELISNKEGQMTKVPFDVDRHAVGRGPSIKIYGPKKSEPSANPFNLQIKFEAFGGASIDPSSIRVLYFSWPRADLTSRLLPELRDGVIDLRDATAPNGDHQLEISVRDSRGYERAVLYEFRVE